MFVTARSKPPETIEQLVGPTLLRRLDRLDVVSRKVFAGKLPGERRSKKRGQSVEFDDYRNYVPGDDLRHVDWNVYARHERFFIKLFREEEDLSLHVIVDCSPSMDAASGDGGPSKLLYAHRLATALGYIGLVNQNRVSVSSFGGATGQGPGGLVRLSPMRGRMNVQRLARFLMQSLAPPDADAQQRTPDDEDFNTAMRAIAAGRAERGIMVVLSDFLFRSDLTRGLNYLAGAGGGGSFDTYCLQLLTPEEVDPARAESMGLVGDLRLTDAETGAGAEVTISGDLIKRYRQRLEEHTAALRSACAARDMAFLQISTDTEPEAVLMETLRGRGLLG